MSLSPDSGETVGMRIRSVAVLAALMSALVVATAVPASARTTVTIIGGGWGHGIGMSQYGAYGRAQNGASSERILEHYYSGSSVTRKQMGRIRVGLLQGRSAIRVTPRKFRDDGGLVVFKEEGVPGRIASGRPGSTFRVEASGTGRMRLYKNDKLVKRDGRRAFGSPAHPLFARYEKQGSMVHVTEKNIAYAYGQLEFGSYQSSCGSGFCLRLVVVLPMQKYIYGLGEVPSSWPMAALRSQAIAGRTYAYEKIQRLGQNRTPCACAVYDSVIDQAYIGDSKRTGSGSYWDEWKAAVDRTKGQVILHRGDPIQALYSSSSGGHTENNENVWGGTPLPYLRGVPDGPDATSANPNHNWRVRMSWNEFESELQRSYGGLGNLERFRIIKPLGVSGRVTVVKSADRGGVKIVGSRTTYRDSGWDIRSALSLKDTLFRINFETSTNREMRSAYEALDGRPGEPVEPAYRRYDSSGRVLALVQHFEHGRMVVDEKTGDVSWTWGENSATWTARTGELVGHGPAFDRVVP